MWLQEPRADDVSVAVDQGHAAESRNMVATADCAALNDLHCPGKGSRWEKHEKGAKSLHVPVPLIKKE